MTLDEATELIDRVLAFRRARSDNASHKSPGKSSDASSGPSDAAGSVVHTGVGNEDSVSDDFVRRYFAHVAPDDLWERDAADLFGAVNAHARLAARRPNHDPLVRVYLPSTDTDGWQSTHTAIDVVTDDMAFLVDSLTNELNRHGLRVHLVMHPVISVRRDSDGKLIGLVDRPLDNGTGTDTGRDDHVTGESIDESYVHIQVDRVRVAQLGVLRDDLLRVLGDVARAVADWRPMAARATELSELVRGETTPARGDDAAEASALLAWMANDHFTFLGYRDYEIIDQPDGVAVVAVPGTGLGILRERERERGGPNASKPPRPPTRPLPRRLSPAGQRWARSPEPLVLAKANSLSTVHRRAYLDYIGLKRFDEHGQAVGERRFLGLFTSKTYHASVFDIPVIRLKVHAVVARAALPIDGHAHKRLIEILETYPRDELFQITIDDLHDHAVGILALQERQQVRLFLRRDQFERYVSCLIFVPRDRYTTAVRQQMAAILKSAFMGTSVDYRVRVTESMLARLHLVVHTVSGEIPDIDPRAIEDQLVDVTRSWGDDLYDALVDRFGEREGVALHQLFAEGFPASYREEFSAATAVDDIARLDTMGDTDDLTMSLYRPAGAAPTDLRLKIYLAGQRISLSEVMPYLENLGVTVVDERPVAVMRTGGPLFWIYDFGLQVSDQASRIIDHNRDLFLDAFRAVWSGRAESDGFNRLVLEAGLSWRTVTLIRAYRKYQRQIGAMFSQSYVVDCLVRHADLARLLMAIFDARFNPDRPAERTADIEVFDLQLDGGLDAITSLDDDRMLRGMRDLVKATLRTNFYQRDADGEMKATLALKLDPAAVPDLPLPRPMFEVFVYSPRVEGVHLRGGRVARGGLRWSDRREDFRTEILGLMKAQMVKNAVIVPAGAKGGFVVKQPPADGDRDAVLAEGIACYSAFIGALLDVTDNIVDGGVVAPADMIRYDSDDPYLVVAADKGTATFSDIANEISESAGFWLGDAFASGGSSGYDHKAMGITAKGAWESVKRHFRELGVDTQSTEFTVVGVGDMSGDVFGNAMLLSPHIRLVAAFDHRHVFIDPEPDAALGYAERHRLFNVPRSSWDDYDRSIISEGGGVFSRSAKWIPVSPQMRAALGLVSDPALARGGDGDGETDSDSDDKARPDDVVQAILRAPADLLFNGGIGTYVKASSESHGDVGDRANDSVRVDAHELRVRVVGEGGNLGLTQRGRIEFARGGGHIYTDAIDNSAGVDCSDHEVNIKILLNACGQAGAFDRAGRDELLVAMTDDVAADVLRDNYENSQALSIARGQAASLANVHSRYMDWLERQDRLDRAVEALPSADEMAERIAQRQGLSPPELAVLQAYTKVLLSDHVLESDLPEDRFLFSVLLDYFPPLVRERFLEPIAAHQLRREIIATSVGNYVVNHGGTSLLFRLADETQAPLSTLVRSYLAAAAMFDLDGLWFQIEALDNQVAAETQARMLLSARRLVERTTRWLVKKRKDPLDLSETVAFYAPGIRTLSASLADALVGADREMFEATIIDLAADRVPRPLATRVAGLENVFSALDIIEVADEAGHQVELVAAAYFELAHRLHLDWLRDQITALPRDTRWHTLARASIRADLYERLRELTASAVQDASATDGSSPSARVSACVSAWEGDRESKIERYQRMLADLGGGDTADLSVLSVALGAVHDLTDG